MATLLQLPFLYSLLNEDPCVFSSETSLPYALILLLPSIGFHHLLSSRLPTLGPWAAGRHVMSSALNQYRPLLCLHSLWNFFCLFATNSIWRPCFWTWYNSSTKIVTEYISVSPYSRTYVFPYMSYIYNSCRDLVLVVISGMTDCIAKPYIFCNFFFKSDHMQGAFSKLYKKWYCVRSVYVNCRWLVTIKITGM